MYPVPSTPTRATVPKRRSQASRDRWARRWWGTPQTVYYRGTSLQRIPGGGISSNHRDVETGDEYWVSGVKKNGEDRHRAGSGGVEIDDDVREEYELLVGRQK